LGLTRLATFLDPGNGKETTQFPRKKFNKTIIKKKQIARKQIIFPYVEIRKINEPHYLIAD
jgi:hypothetical protein